MPPLAAVALRSSPFVAGCASFLLLWCYVGLEGELASGARFVPCPSSMDVMEGSRAAAATDGFSRGFVHSVVGYSSSPLFLWLLTVALVAAIHLASGYISPSSSSR